MSESLETLKEAISYAYRLGYFSADRARDMQDYIDTFVQEHAVVQADLEKTYKRCELIEEQLDTTQKEVEQWKWDYNRLSELCSSKVEQVTKDHDKARAEVERLTKERDEALAKINGQKDALLEAARQVTDAAFQQAEMDRLKRELEQAIAERTPHDYGIIKEQRDHYRDRLCASIKETQEVRTEVEQLKQALHDARLENSGQAALIEQLKEKVDQLQYVADFEKAHLFKRQEPSRLEIAAMLKAAWLSNADYKSEDRCDEGWWIEQADALIEAAKGSAK
jgi:DNA repair exonuclease SbcCD ATPase subunit